MFRSPCLFPRMQPRCLNLNRGKDGNGAAFFSCALCASEKSSQNRLTALWAVGRFLPRWASSPAWQRRLDVIKVYTLSAVGESVWNGLCCCQKHGLLLCISILHGKSQRSTRNTDDHSCIFIFWCHLLRLQRFSRCCFFFFPPRFFFFSQSELKGEEGSSLTKRSSLCQRPDIFVMYDKAPLRNMIALVKRTNYSPLTTFQTHFYWSIQPNKTLLHWQKGMPSFLHIFSKPRVYMIPVITPLWHLNFIEQDFKICRQYIKGIYSFQMGGESPISRVLRGADWHILPIFWGKKSVKISLYIPFTLIWQ